jgi:hypothetical protein
MDRLDIHDIMGGVFSDVPMVETSLSAHVADPSIHAMSALSGRKSLPYNLKWLRVHDCTRLVTHNISRLPRFRKRRIYPEDCASPKRRWNATKVCETSRSQQVCFLLTLPPEIEPHDYIEEITE